MFFAQNLAHRFRQLSPSLPLVVLFMLCQLLPRRRHELFLLEANDHGSKSGGSPVSRVQVEFSKPVWSFVVGRNRTLSGVPLAIERRAHHRGFAAGWSLFRRRIQNFAQRRLKRLTRIVRPWRRFSFGSAKRAFQSQHRGYSGDRKFRHSPSRRADAHWTKSYGGGKDPGNQPPRQCFEITFEACTEFPVVVNRKPDGVASGGNG